MVSGVDQEESFSNIVPQVCPSTLAVSVPKTSAGWRPRRFLRPALDMKLVRKGNLRLAESSEMSQCQRLSEQFDIQFKLGEGSFAVVYRARDRKHNREVALKIVRTDECDELQIAQNEYNLLQQIHHPNVIKVLDFFTYAYGAVLVQTYFSGEDLEKTITLNSDGFLAESNACQLFIQLLDALAYLHRIGIIHRDVKAQNILISSCLTDLRLTDFNSSKLLADGAALTIVGTPQYMPPEVLEGNSPSEASDVWASGLCFYYMLIGSLPKRHTGTHLKLESPKWARLSVKTEEVMLKCLAPRRDARPSASEILSMYTQGNS